MLVKGVRPELDIQISSRKKGTDSITNITVGTLNWTILMRCISSSRMNSITLADEKIADIRIAKKFSSLVHTDVLAAANRGIRGKEVAKLMDGRSLGNAGITMLDSSKIGSN